MTDADVRKRCEEIRLLWRSMSKQSRAMTVREAIYLAAYADGQRDGMERVVKAISNVQPKGAPGLMDELTWTAWEMCERILAKIRQAAGEVGRG